MPWQLQMIVLLACVSAPIQWYVAHRLAGALRSVTNRRKRSIRTATYLVVFYPALYPLAMLGGFLSGTNAVSRSSTLVDDVFKYPFWIGVVIAVQLAMILVVLDLARLILFPIYRRHKDRAPLLIAWLTLGLAFLSGIYCAVRIRTDTSGLRTERVVAHVAGLAPELSGLKIVQLSDVHVDRYTNGAKLQAYTDRANANDPDLIVFCGDLISSGTDYIEQAARAMGGLRARYGVYACLGDHDYFSDPEMVTERLEANGLVVLRDASRTIEAGSARICLTGVTNVYRRPADRSTVQRLAAARPHGQLDIFMTHQPSTWLVQSVAAGGYDLFLGGHTHGGQITFPLPGFLLTGSSFETHYVTGSFQLGSTLASITNGLGMTLAPIRYQAPAEVTVISVER